MPTTRRGLLRTAGGLALLWPVVGCATLGRLSGSENPFTLGVASGDPLPDGVVLWTRLAPDPLNGGGMDPAPVEVRWEVAADPAMRRIVRKGAETAVPELTHAVHAEVAGLEPGRDYWYRFSAGPHASPVGRTRTAPAPDAAVERIRFAFCGCQHYETGYYTAYRHLAGDNVEFGFHSGDYIYEYAGRDDQVRRHPPTETVTLADYRTRYALYKTDPDLQAAHASAPFIVSFDDHEVDNNWAGDHPSDAMPRDDFLRRRAAAFQAYYEHMPLRRRARPNGSTMQLFRRLGFGRLIDLHVLDTRQYRDDQGCNDGWKHDCPAVDDPARTMLGQTQERWLDLNLKHPNGAWTVLAQQMPTWQALRPGRRGLRTRMDQWDGYAPARERLYRSLADNGIANAVVLSGDVHCHVASELRMDFDDPASRRVGVEFTNTSISSDGDGADVAPFWERIKAQNPHIKYYRMRRGYVTCEVTPERWVTEFKTVPQVSVRDAPIAVDRRFAVDRRAGGLELA